MVAFYALLSLGPLMYLLTHMLNLLFRSDGTTDAALGRVAVFLPPEAVSLLGAVIGGLHVDQPLLLLAVPGLIWVASSACSSLEYAVNVASGTAPQRKFWHSRLKGLLVLSSGFVLLGLALISGSVLPWFERVARSLDLEGPPQTLLALSGPPIQLLATLSAFVSFYKLLPRGRVRWPAALTGAVLALALWESARQLFTLLLARSPAFGLVSGTVAGVVAFLLWVYTAVAIILLGAELSAVLNGNRRGQEH